MAIIRRSLHVLYSGDMVDIAAATDLVVNLATILDRALAGTTCPFQTFEQSLLAFSRAIYALRLEGGRCAAPGNLDGCGLYDPEGLYYNPPVSTIAYTGEPLTYSAAEQAYPSGIPSSFGIDLLEVTLDPSAPGQPLAIEFYGNPGARARFAVQIWKVENSGKRSSLQPGVQLFGQGATRQTIYLMDEAEATGYDRVALAITRLDAWENADQEGSYNIRLYGADQSGPVPSDSLR
ncbi:MAG: hypothetical protein P8129_23860 [Anaerolineae bacterium]